MAESIKQMYDRAGAMCAQEKYSEARQIAHAMLGQYPDDLSACRHAYIILAIAETTPLKCLTFLKPLLANAAYEAWAIERYQQLKQSILAEAELALAERNIAAARDLLSGILEIEPEDVSARGLLNLADEFENQPTPSASPTAPQADHAQESPAEDEPAPVIAEENAKEEQEPTPHEIASPLPLAWSAPFQTEQDVAESFEHHVTALIQKASTPVTDQIKVLHQNLDYALAQKQTKWATGRPINIFLSPAIRTSAGLVEELLLSGRPREAFESANIFGEMCKIPLARSTRNFTEIFERLLLTALRAVREITQEEVQACAAQEELAELEVLEDRLQRACLIPASSSFFDANRNALVAGSLRIEAADRLKHETLAEYFEDRSWQLQKADRAQYQTFIKRNRSVILCLPLSSERRRELERMLETESTASVIAPESGAQQNADHPALPDARGELWTKYPVPMALLPQQLSEIVEKSLQWQQQEEVIAWLNARMNARSPNTYANYHELARIYEERVKDPAKAFDVLEQLVLMQLQTVGGESQVSKTGHMLLGLCHRHGRRDWASRLHARIENSNLEPHLLRALTSFSNSDRTTEASSAEELAAQFLAPEENFRQEGFDFQRPSRNTNSISSDRAQARLTQSENAGRVGIFVDHENLWENVLKLNQRHGLQLPEKPRERVLWFGEIIDRLLFKIKTEFHSASYRIAVAYWERSFESRFLSAYIKHRFVPVQPEEVWVWKKDEQNPSRRKKVLKGGVDFKLADEIRRAQHHALISGSCLRQVIIISGDGDYAHLVSNLLEDEIAAQIWGISQSINHDAYTRIIGAGNIREIDSLCRYALA